MPKTVIIGGGSYTWGPIFLRDILSTPGLKGSVIVLEDVVQDRVDLVYALGQKMIDDFGLDFHLEKTLSLDEALNGADFIILTITTGRLESMQPDVEIPMKYGIKQSVGDTTGPGGLSRALRNIPIVADMAGKVDEICPNAFFLNYTNPMSVLTYVINKFRSMKYRTVGLCHEWIGVREKLASILDVKPEHIQAKVAGINHLIWLTDLYANGRRLWDEIPVITEKILNDEILVDKNNGSVFADHAKVKSTLFKIYGALPAAGDRHIAEFFPHFINEATHSGADYRLTLTSIEDRAGLDMFAKMMIESALRGETDLKPFMAEHSGEAASQILAAITNGGRYTGMMNLPNMGQISNLPSDSVVETHGTIDNAGAHAIIFGDLPAGIQNVLEHHIRQQEMTIEAALTGDRELALQVLLNDPLSNRLSIGQAMLMLEELLEANKQYLPRFFIK